MKSAVVLLVSLLAIRYSWGQTYSLAPSSGQNGFAVFDSRNINSLPQEKNRGFYGDFKYNTIDGLNDGGTYNGLLTFRQYGTGTDFTGGLSHQLGFTDRNNLWLRSGRDSTWGGWDKIWTSGNDGASSGLDADLIKGQTPQWATNGSTVYSTNSGNVLIGKSSQTNTAYRLDVNGDVRANKVVVNTTGADYVFDSSYYLLSLPQLNRYLHDYHHLPGVETAPEMRQRGLDLGATQTILLQKIEELTRYLISQDQKIDMLESQLKSLRQDYQLITKNAPISKP